MTIGFEGSKLLMRKYVTTNAFQVLRNDIRLTNIYFIFQILLEIENIVSWNKNLQIFVPRNYIFYFKQNYKDFGLELYL